MVVFGIFVLLMCCCVIDVYVDIYSVLVVMVIMVVDVLFLDLFILCVCYYKFLVNVIRFVGSFFVVAS